MTYCKPLPADLQIAAASLLAVRPRVLPGTRVIPDAFARRVYYRAVNDEMMRLRLDDPATIAGFCEAAGIPD